jgi:CubicO group peptidase (beta-lactamase class C family)/ketosteroid isomerase-like protein
MKLFFRTIFKIFLILTILFGCATTGADRLAGRVNADEDAVIQTYETCATAWKTGDVETLKQLYHPEFTVFYESGGQLETLNWDAINALFDVGTTVEGKSELDVKVYGNTAITTGIEERITIPHIGAQKKVRYRISITWLKVAGRWQMVHEHQSPLRGDLASERENARTAIPLKTDIDKGAWITDLKTFIPQLMERAHVPGLSIAVIRDAEIIWSGSFGVKSNETKEAVNDTTVFQAASLSKTTFAYAVMKLVERGELDLDTPLSDYLPGRYIENDDRVKLITARMVLSHTTGFPNWRPKGGALRLYFTPGEKFSYSGEGYVYLQKVVEHITGQPLDRFMQEQVFEPLGMRHSSYEWRDEYESNYAVGHNYFGIATDGGPMRHANAASSLYTTAGDYARFLVAMMRGSGLQEKSVREMLTPQVQLESCVICTHSKLRPSKLSEVNTWGLGWGLQTTDEGTSFWHWGDQGIFMCYTVAFKDQKLGLVYFTNSKNGLAIRNELVYRTIGGRHPAFSWAHYDSYQVLDFPKVDTTVDVGIYDDYVGQYAYAILTVTREGDRVFAQLTGQPKFEIFPKSETEFFWKVVDAQVEFVKDDEGKVTHALHDQGGIELTRPKIKDTDVDADIVGQYVYTTLTVTREGDRLFAQLTGQRKFEIFPKSETEFFWKVVNAQVTFVKNEAGVVTHARHRQRGEFDAPKIKPGLTKILKAIPAAYTIPYGNIVYVENDGRCSQGKVIKITGGHGGRGIPRKYECVKRPE